MLSARPEALRVPMTLPWFSKATTLVISGSRRSSRLLVLTFCLLGAQIAPRQALGHPELLLQIEQLTLELQQQPDNVELLIQRGDLWRRHEDFPAAANDFSAARRLQSDLAVLDFYQGRLSLDAGLAAEAELLLSRYLRHQPEHANAWVLLGEAQLELSRPQAAAENFGQAIIHSERPTPSLFLQQGQALFMAGPEYWAVALGVADAGLERFPRDVSLLGLATDIALDLQQPAAAGAYLQRLPDGLRSLPQWAARFQRQLELK